MKNYLELFCVVWLLVLLAPLPASAAGMLDMGCVQGIYLGQTESMVLHRAAVHLQAGLKKIYGIDLPIIPSGEEPVAGQPLIRLGRVAALGAERVTGEDLQEVAPGGHVILCDATGMTLAGNSAWDSLFGVYHLLERLGMHFFSPTFEEAVFKKKTDPKIKFFSMKERPVFAYRSGRSRVNRQMFDQLGDPRNGLNPELFDRQSGSDLWIDHSAGYLVPKALYYDEHPEFYALEKTGKRIEKGRFTDHRTPLCLSNQEVAALSGKRALGWIANEPDKDYFFITYGDTGVWCQCDQCQRLDSSSGDHADRLLSWVNPVARTVAARYPDKVLLTFAYGGTDEPPVTMVPQKNVWVMGSTGLGGVSFWDHSLAQGRLPGRQLDKLAGWLAVAPEQYGVCEYQSGLYKPALVDSMTARLRFYQQKGIRGVAFSYGHPRNFTPVWDYLWGRLMWNPNQKSIGLAREFIFFHYKGAAKQIWKIFVRFHERYEETLDKGISLGKDGYPKGFYSDRLTDDILAHFSRASGRAEGDETLQQEIRREETFFLLDRLSHPPDEVFDATFQTQTYQLLDRLLLLTGDSAQEKNKLIQAIHRRALLLEQRFDGVLQIVTEWIHRKNLYQMNYQKISSGIRLLPEAFVFSGFGPARYGYNCPVKYAVGVYVKGNSKQYSHRMVAEFELESVDEGKEAILELEGQISAAHPLRPRITLLINGKEIYSGRGDFVTRNWSKQSYPVPPGVLQVGRNRLEIRNDSLPLSIVRWNQRWFLLSDLVLRLR